MKQKVRELLVTAKVAQNWQTHFDQKVEELMSIVNKIDTDKKVLSTTELLDVYHKAKEKPAKSRRKKVSDFCDRPFEFLVFRN